MSFFSKRPKMSLWILLVTLCNKNYYCKEFRKLPDFYCLHHCLHHYTILSTSKLAGEESTTPYQWYHNHMTIIDIIITRQKLNQEILSLLSLRYQSKEILKYLPTFFSLSLSGVSDYVQRVKDINISRINQNIISQLSVFRSFSVKFGPKKQNFLFTFWYLENFQNYFF